MFFIHITFDFGSRYVRYAQLADGTWLTGRKGEAKEWKTRKGAERWIAGHPELIQSARIIEK
jgi:hypothetical protein